MAAFRIASIVWLAAVLVAAPACAQQAPPNLGAYVTLASGYWNRGFAQNGGATLQVGLDYQHHSGWFAGAWAMNVDYEIDYSRYRPREIEVDLYAGFNRRSEAWSWTVTVGRYLYPGAAGAYEYDEVSAAFGVRDRLFYTASYSDDLYGAQRAALNQELAGIVPLRGDVEIGVAVGRFEIDGGLEQTHWNVGVSKLLKRLAFDVRYYDGSYEWPTRVGDPDASHVVLSVSYALRSKRLRI